MPRTRPSSAAHRTSGARRRRRRSTATTYRSASRKRSMVSASWSGRRSLGDFDQRKHRKFKEPVKGKGFRTLFRKAGYGVYLVDEFRTSCRCSACGGEWAKPTTFRVCESDSPRPNRTGRILRHGLVKCNTCSTLWNRDTNAASNIWKIAMSAIRGEARPESGALTRARSASSMIYANPTHPNRKFRMNGPRFFWGVSFPQKKSSFGERKAAKNQIQRVQRDRDRRRNARAPRPRTAHRFRGGRLNQRFCSCSSACFASFRRACSLCFASLRSAFSAF
jgi:hypothetical protein